MLPNLKFIIPEISLSIFAFMALGCSLLPLQRKLAGWLSLIGVIVSLGLLLTLPQAPKELILNLLVSDPFSIFFKVLALITLGAVILISMGSKNLPRDSEGEYYFLLLCAGLAILFAVSSNHLLMIYLSLEMLSLTSYLLVGFQKRDAFSSEAALKYFLFGALSTGIMLYGISWVYGIFKTNNLAMIFELFRSGAVNPALAFMALLFILAGLCFKCALVPFHLWVPDTYQGAPTPVTAFISVGPKLAGFAILLRFFGIICYPMTAASSDLLVGIAILTMTLGNIIAISQNNIKRMLGYSSIAHAGFILMGMVSGDALGMESVLYYLLAYALMNLGAFACVVLIESRLRSECVDDYSGLYKKDPSSALALSLFLLSLVGIPPLTGFIAKFLVLAAALQSKLYNLAIAGAANSVIAAFYYLKVIRIMYLEEPKIASSPSTSASFPLKFIVIILLAGVLLLGLLPQAVLHWIGTAQIIYL